MSTTHPSTFILARGELASRRLGSERWRVSAVAGRLWVTMSGRAEDWMLCAGDTLSFNGRGTIVVQALKTATVRLEEVALPRPAQGVPLPLAGKPGQILL